MSKCRLLAFVITTLMSANAYSQGDTLRNVVSEQSSGYLSVLIGYNGFDNDYIELGIARSRLYTIWPHSLGISYFASTEFELGKDPLVGPKVGMWFGGGLALGVNAIYYTNFNAGAFKFRPEVGFGLDRFKLVYGYNLDITHNENIVVNTHNFSIAYLIRFKTLNIPGKRI